MNNSTSKFTIFLISCITCISFTFCKNKDDIAYQDKIDLKSEFSTKIAQSAGDLILQSGKESKTPFIFNMGTYQVNDNENIETIILSNQISKGKFIDIRPIGIFSFEQEEAIQKYLISIPIDSVYNTLKIEDYSSFSTTQFEIKNMIEDWFRSNCELGQCKNFKWGGEILAFQLIDKIQAK